jgi:uncharacterized protein YcfJ
MKHKFLRTFAVVPLLAGISFSAESFPVAQPAPANHSYMMEAAYKPSPATRRKVVKRRSRKKSAAIVGGSALGGAAVGGLVGGKKGAAVGALAGGGGGYVYDRKSQQKPVVPK